MKTNDIIERILDFERRKDLYEFIFEDTKLPIWMFIRCGVVETVLRRELGVTGITSKNILYDHSKSILECTIKNPFFINHKEIVYAFYDNELWEKDNEGQIYEKRYFPYINYMPQKSTTIVNFKWKNEFGLECGYPNWRSDFVFRQYIDSNNSHKSSSAHIAKRFINYLIKYFPYKLERQLCTDILNRINYYSKTHSKAIRICEKYLIHVKPKIVIIDRACYRQPLNIAMLLACKNKNILTAEFQHGFVGEATAAPYIYSKDLFSEKKINKFFPDYFLTMGNYWNNLVQIPSQCYTIGKFGLDRLKKISNNNILFVASTEYESYENLLNELLKYEDMGYTIYFRLHPREHSDRIIKRFEKYTNNKKFKLAKGKDIFYYLNKCSYVIGDASTTILEAISTGRIVFALNNSLYENYTKKFNDGCINEFSDANDFITLWKRRNELKPNCDNLYFDIEWKKNYRAFLRKVGVKI